MILEIPAISCDHCKMTVERVARGFAGVRAAAVNVAEKTLEIEAGPELDLEGLQKALEEEGYKVARIRS